MSPFFEPTPVGSALAAALVVAGAPLFGAGLRIVRLRRQLSVLREQALADLPLGFVMVRGRVALESPLVGPLSGRPCAGYRLEVWKGSHSVIASIESRRPFRISAGPVSARVAAGDAGAWAVAITDQRTVSPSDTLSHNLNALLAGSPEATWLRRCGVTITLVERSLTAGQDCVVIGSARRGRPYELTGEVELARTGTDGGAVVSARSSVHEPDLWIESDAHLGFLRVSDRVPSPGEIRVPRWGALGIVLGPTLGLAGLLYLAAAADRWRAAAGH